MQKFPFLFLVVILATGGCGGTPSTSNTTTTPENATSSNAKSQPPAVAAQPRATALRLGTSFHPYDASRPHQLQVKKIEIPDFPGTYAIWGGTGRDDQGNIWLGASATWTKEAPTPSTRAFRFTPNTETLTLTGDAVGQLRELKLHREEDLELNAEGNPVKTSAGGKLTRCQECQMKIHTKFIPMDDGYLYFASMDEWGENEDGSSPPHWGSHLWRVKMNDAAGKWEHVASLPEAIIAASGVGRYLYLLGYFDHVVYCYDTQTNQIKKRAIGSYRGHISRNLLADANGHAYVPRITPLNPENGSNKNPEFKVELIELDPQLQEIGATPLEHYSVTGDAASHGITGLAYLDDASLAFTTADGFLYRIFPQMNAKADVQPWGWFHADGKAYAPGLFSLDGQRYLAGITVKKGANVFDWVVYDLEKRESRHETFPVRDDPAQNILRLLLYGSVTRDDAGRFYLVGNYSHVKQQRELPICLQVTYTAQGTEK